MRTLEDFRDLADGQRFTDPMAGLLSAIRTGHTGRFNCRIDLAIRPAAPRWLKAAKKMSVRIRAGFRSARIEHCYHAAAMHPSVPIRLAVGILAKIARRKPAEENAAISKLEEPVFECFLTLSVSVPDEAVAVTQRKLKEIAGAFARFNADAGFAIVRHRRKMRWGFALTAKAVATIWHPLTL